MRDELLVVLDLYLSEHRVLEEYDPRVVAVSELLNQLPIHAEAGTPGFRTPDAVVLRLANFRSYDPTTPARGMRNAGRAAEEVWNRFAHQPERVTELVEAIMDAAVSLDKPSRFVAEEFEDEFPEGRLLFRVHLVRERHPELRKRKLRQLIATGRDASCEICGLEPDAVYRRTAAERVLECHHRKPLEAGARRTRLDDVVLACANCHRAIHGLGVFGSVEALRTAVLLDSAAPKGGPS